MEKVCGGTSHFANRQFPKSVILASCNFAGRPFAAYYACCVVYFFPDTLLLIASNAGDLYWLLVD